MQCTVWLNGSIQISESANSIPGGKDLGGGERRVRGEGLRGEGVRGEEVRGEGVRGEGAREGGRDAGEDGTAPPVCRERARDGRRAAEREQSKRGQAEDGSYSKELQLVLHG